jgi:acyl-CoA synthetase (AMP-forming)/AMP-acid ligase II
MNTAVLLAKAARVHGERSALKFGDRRWTYAELDAWTGSVAAGLLGLGLRRGDRVVLWMRNRPELVALFFGCLKAGLCAVPVNMRLHPSEVAYIVENSGARAIAADETFTPEIPPPGVVVFDAGHLPAGPSPLAPASDVDEEAAWLFYTSGTTGRPKGAVLTHRNLLAATMNCLADIHSFQPEEVVLHVAPLTHGSGMYMLPAIARGATNLVSHHASFDPPAVFELIERERVTAIAFLAPTMIVKLLNDPSRSRFDLSSIAFSCYGGGPMYVEHIKQTVTAMGRIWVQIYGQGETPMTATYLRAADHRWDDPDSERRLGSVGIPRTDVEVRILDTADNAVETGDVGEICVRAETVMRGYWGDADATAAALRGGWLHTGDLGYMDDASYVFLVDRAKDMIISAGNNIYAREVEEALLTHPDVLEAAVIGVPDEYWGESVHAVVVRRTGGGEVTSGELIEHVRGRLASYKKPRTVEFVDELPKSAYGKVLKRELRERVGTGPGKPGPYDGT